MLVEKLSLQLLISNPRSNEPIVLVLNRDLAGNASNLPGTIYTMMPFLPDLIYHKNTTLILKLVEMT